MCGFGIHIEKRPHRFDRLREDNPKEWEYWMYRCCIDANGENYGWGRVLVRGRGWCVTKVINFYARSSAPISRVLVYVNFDRTQNKYVTENERQRGRRFRFWAGLD